MNSTSYSIRPLEPSDALAVAALLRQQGVFEGTLQLPDTQLAARAERYAKPDGQALRLVAVAAGDTLASMSASVIGFGALYAPGPSLRQQHVRGLALAIAPTWQGQGVGKALMTRLLDWADNWAGVLRIELSVFADNAPAIALYKRFGFEQEGLMRAHALRAGQYADSLMMARLHPQAPVLRSAANPA